MTEAIRFCNDIRLAEGEFSGGKEVLCTAVLLSDGNVKNTCGEPCRWIMRKAGHGLPPWQSEDRNQ